MKYRDALGLATRTLNRTGGDLSALSPCSRWAWWCRLYSQLDYFLPEPVYDRACARALPPPEWVLFPHQVAAILHQLDIPFRLAPLSPSQK